MSDLIPWPPMTHEHPDGFACHLCMEEWARLTRERDELRAIVEDDTVSAERLEREYDRAEKAEAEVERLRAALRRFLDGDELSDDEIRAVLEGVEP